MQKEKNKSDTIKNLQRQCYLINFPTSITLLFLQHASTRTNDNCENKSMWIFFHMISNYWIQVTNALLSALNI